MGKSRLKNTYHAICVLCGIVLFMLAVREARADVSAPTELKRVQPKFTKPLYRYVEMYDKANKHAERRCWFFEFDPKTGRMVPADNLPITGFCMPVENEDRRA
jgi:hypothetical protein